MATSPIRLVVFDWAGTIIDFGSRAPLEAFVQVFADHGVRISAAEARGPMGRHKKDHLRELFALPEVRERWRAEHGRPPNDDDLETMYRDLVPAQLATLRRFDRLVPGARACVTELRSRGVRLGGTTGYFRAAAEVCLAAAREQGLELDANLCGDDVPAGRPAPWMVFRLMEAFGVYPASAVLKVGDTRVDIEEGRNAGAWSVGVCATGNEMGLSAEEYEALSGEERERRLAEVARTFEAAGAHATVRTLAELPGLVDGWSLG